MTLCSFLDGFALFHDETLVSFFRRPAFSPDGAILALPTGLRTPATPNAASKHGIYLNWRNNLHQAPIAFIGGFEKAAVAIKFNPKLFKKPECAAEPYIPLPYVFVFAIVTQNTVYVYDSLRRNPIYAFGNLHYASLTDAAWSCDGNTLIVSSVDGFCSAITFSEDDFGTPMLEDQATVIQSITQVIKASSFHNPPPKPSKRPINLDESILLSSEVDIEADTELSTTRSSSVASGVFGGLATAEEVNNGNNNSNSTGNNHSSPSTANESPSEPVVHCPPVKKRIAPTLLSSSVTTTNLSLQ